MADDFSRYSRQIFIEEIGVSGQRKIMAAKVLVVGAGGLGSPVIQYLAAAGVGTLAVADPDTVEIHNLNRQTIHNEKSIGRSKADSARDFVRSLNSSIELIPMPVKMDLKNAASIIAPYDVVVDGSDNFLTRYCINDACVAMNKALVYGSIFAQEGQLAVFNHKGGKHLRDLFPEPPSSASVPDCDQFGVVGALCGIVGSMMALQALQVIVDLQPLHDQLLLIDTKNWQFNKISF